jgi:hypothetical protein
MTQRERSLFLVVVAVGAFVVLFGGFVTAQNLLAGLDEKDQQIESLQREVSDKETKLLALGLAQRKLDRWKAISLPPDLETARSRYRAFLQELCRRNHLQLRQIRESGLVQTTGASKTAASFTSLTYQVQVAGTLPQLVGLLREFYALNLPHQIREITITNEAAAGSATPLEIALKIEALSMPNAPQREFVLPVPDARVLLVEAATALERGPTGLASGIWLIGPTGAGGSKKLAASAGSNRDYLRLGSKDIFAGLRPPPPPGPPPIEVLKSVQLTRITLNTRRTEASLRNRVTDSTIHLSHGGPFDAFEVRDGKGQVVLKGKVKAISQRCVEFTAGTKDYRLCVGETLYEVLHPDKLSPEEIKALTLGPTADKKVP